MKPSIGRIVHFVIPGESKNAGEHCAAVVTRVWTDSCVNLHLLPDEDQNVAVRCMPQDFTPTSVTIDETGKQPRSWHWPEKVD